LSPRTKQSSFVCREKGRGANFGVVTAERGSEPCGVGVEPRFGFRTPADQSFEAQARDEERRHRDAVAVHPGERARKSARVTPVACDASNGGDRVGRE